MSRFSRALYLAVALMVLTPWVSSGVALLAGIVLGLTIGNPFLGRTRGWSAHLLQISVMGLGAGMNLDAVMRAGASGIGYTIVGIACTLVLGTLMGKWLKTDSETSVLVNAGTAICGGSAIAAVASTIRARPEAVSVALATVFFLNATALFVFPWIGHSVGLDQQQFGLWAALAIHDTSSVVGAGLQYGPEALEVATTVKLARALWIVPLAFAIGFVWSRGGAAAAKAKKPWFILGFLVIAALVTYIPALQEPGRWVAEVAKRALVLTLFLIGSSITRATLKQVGARPLVQGVLLWLVVAGGSLAAILSGWVH